MTLYLIVYKFYAIVFFSFPLLFIVLYSINSSFFFDHIFMYILLFGALAYLSFVLYLLSTTFLSIRNDTVLKKLIEKLTKLNWLRFLHVHHILNAVSFIWVTFLSAVSVTLVLFFIFTLTIKTLGSFDIVKNFFADPRVSTEIYNQNEQIEKLNKNTQYLIDARLADLSNKFFSVNEHQYTDIDSNFEYRIYYENNDSQQLGINPAYHYNLMLCYDPHVGEVCVLGPSLKITPAAFVLSQDEVIEDLQGDLFTFNGAEGDLSSSLHRVRLVTNKRDIDMMVVAKKAQLSFTYLTNTHSLPVFNNETYEFLSETENSMDFTFTRFTEGQKDFSLTKTFRYDPALKEISPGNQSDLK